MRLAYYPGCQISTGQYGYELSLRKLMPVLDVEMVDVNGFSCCGGPMKNLSLNMSYYLALRNIAIASTEGLDMLAPCNVCHLSLTEAMEKVRLNPELLGMMKERLAQEGLEWNGPVKVIHPVEILHENIEVIRGMVKRPIGKFIAAHYGCQLIRYGDLERVDDPEVPHKMEDILESIGATTATYPERINCCGGLLVANHRDSALTKAGQKLEAVKYAGFDGLVDTCPWGHRLMDGQQQDAAQTVGESLDVPVIYLTQLVGYALGMDPLELGMELNLSKPLFGGTDEEEPEGAGGEKEVEGNAGGDGGSAQ